MIPFIGALAGIEMFTQFTDSNFFLPLVILSIGMTSLGLFMSVTHLGNRFASTVVLIIYVTRL